MSVSNSKYLMKIPIYDVYTQVLVFPSPVPNLEVCFKIQIIFVIICFPQGICNVALVTMDTEPIKTSGDFIMAPFFKGHDYVLLPSKTARVIYYDHVPECLQNFPYAIQLKHPEVKYYRYNMFIAKLVSFQVIPYFPQDLTSSRCVHMYNRFSALEPVLEDVKGHVSKDTDVNIDSKEVDYYESEAISEVDDLIKIIAVEKTPTSDDYRVDGHDQVSIGKNKKDDDTNVENKEIMEDILDELLLQIFEESCSHVDFNMSQITSNVGLADEFELVKKGKKVKGNKLNNHTFVSYNKFAELDNEMDFSNENMLSDSEEKIHLKKKQKVEKSKIKKNIRISKLNKKWRKSNELQSIRKKNNTTNHLIRCLGCFNNHFPLPKFCRWWEEKNAKYPSNIKQPTQLEKDEILHINERIQYLEGQIDETYSHPEIEMNRKIVDIFFKRSKESCNLANFPDIFNFNKLRGGGEKHRVAIKSENIILDSVLSMFRDMVPLWHNMDSHLLCNHRGEPACFYCLLRSLSLRSMNPQVRRPISALEVLPFLKAQNVDKLNAKEIINQTMKYLTDSEERVSPMFKSIFMNCKLCQKDVSIQSSEIFNLNVLDTSYNLQEMLNSHLQQQINHHYTSFHFNSPKHNNLNDVNIKISENRFLLLVVLDKAIPVDLDNSLLVGGKMLNCISAIKMKCETEGSMQISTVYSDNKQWTVFDDNSKKQATTCKDSFKCMVFTLETFNQERNENKSALIYSRSVLNDYFRERTTSGRKRRATFKEKNPESGRKRQSMQKKMLN